MSRNNVFAVSVSDTGRGSERARPSDQWCRVGPEISGACCLCTMHALVFVNELKIMIVRS